MLFLGALNLHQFLQYDGSTHIVIQAVSFLLERRRNRLLKNDPKGGREIDGGWGYLFVTLFILATSLFCLFLRSINHVAQVIKRFFDIQNKRKRQ